MKAISVWQIRCRAEDVSAKAEIVPTCEAEIPFADPHGDEDPA